MADELELTLGQDIKDEPSFAAPDGDYRFFVKDWQVGRYEPPKDEDGNYKGKIPPCKQVEVTLLIPYRDEDGNVVYGEKVERFKLLARLKFAITKFFIACGLGKRGDTFKLDFDQCKGRVGTCKVMQQVGANGSVYSYIDEFYDPTVAPQTTMNDGLPFFEPPQPPQQPQQQPMPQQQQGGYGYNGYGY